MTKDELIKLVTKLYPQSMQKKELAMEQKAVTYLPSCVTPSKRFWKVPVAYKMFTCDFTDMGDSSLFIRTVKSEINKYKHALNMAKKHEQDAKIGVAKHDPYFINLNTPSHFRAEQRTYRKDIKAVKDYASKHSLSNNQVYFVEMNGFDNTIYRHILTKSLVIETVQCSKFKATHSKKYHHTHLVDLPYSMKKAGIKVANCGFPIGAF